MCIISPSILPRSLLHPSSLPPSTLPLRLKPPWLTPRTGNIMIADDGTTPVLMDFGSLTLARIPIPTRTLALYHQDLAAEHCTMSYRAPELFDIKTGTTLTEKVDVWALGCTLFALLYGYSPFEPPSDQLVGDSIALAVTQGSYKFPGGVGGYSEGGAKQVVRRCLVVQPEGRPSVREVRMLVEEIIQGMESVAGA